jgi:hypothetical protein
MPEVSILGGADPTSASPRPRDTRQFLGILIPSLQSGRFAKHRPMSKLMDKCQHPIALSWLEITAFVVFTTLITGSSLDKSVY